MLSGSSGHRSAAAPRPGCCGRERSSPAPRIRARPAAPPGRASPRGPAPGLPDAVRREGCCSPRRRPLVLSEAGGRLGRSQPPGLSFSAPSRVRGAPLAALTGWPRRSVVPVPGPPRGSSDRRSRPAASVRLPALPERRPVLSERLPLPERPLAVPGRPPLPERPPVLSGRLPPRSAWPLPPPGRPLLVPRVLLPPRPEPVVPPLPLRGRPPPPGPLLPEPLLSLRGRPPPPGPLLPEPLVPPRGRPSLLEPLLLEPLLPEPPLLPRGRPPPEPDAPVPPDRRDAAPGLPVRPWPAWRFWPAPEPDARCPASARDAESPSRCPRPFPTTVSSQPS
jgi:hypothetical protein